MKSVTNLPRIVFSAVMIFGVAQNGLAEIQIIDGTRIVQSGGSVSLASVTQNAVAPSKILTIRNTGSTAVNLGTAGSVASTNDIAIVNNYGANQILAAGQSYSITVQLKSTSTGYKSGVLTLVGQKINAFGSVTSGEIIVDDLDPGFSVTGAWPTQSPGYGGRQLRTPGTGKQTSTSTASWTFTGLTPGTYDIGVTWGGGSKALASNAQYVIRDGPTVWTAAANQWYVTQSDFPIVGGQPFQRLSRVTIKSTSLVVTVTNASNFSSNDIAADAMLIKPVK